MYVIGMSDRLPGLMSQLEGSQPDVLLLDWELSTQSMPGLLTDLNCLEQRPKTIVLAANPEDKAMILTAGADYSITKNAPPDELLPILNDIRLSKTKKAVRTDDQELTN